MPLPIAGAVAVVKLDLLLTPQAAAGPLAFLGAIYQLYCVVAVKPLALYEVDVVLAVGEAGVTAPVQI